MASRPPRDATPTNQIIDKVLQETSESIAQRQIGKNDGWASRADSRHASLEATHLAIIWLVRYNPEKYLQQILGGLTYFARTQHHRRNTNPQRHKRNDGGWGTQEDRESDPNSTARAVYAFVRYLQWAQDHQEVAGGKAATAEYIEAAREGLNWLKSHVKRKWWHTETQPGNLSATEAYWTCLALRESQTVDSLEDLEIKDPLIPQAFKVVEDTYHSAKEPQNNGSGWGLTLAGEPALGPTAYCSYLLLNYTQNPQKLVAQKGLDQLQKEFENLDNAHAFNKRLEAGDRPLVEPIGRAIVALLTDKRAHKSIEQAIKYLLTCYEEPTGWRDNFGRLPDLVSTQSALRALHEYKQGKKPDLIRSPGPEGPGT